MDDVVFSITANLDLLGFSAHLSLGSSDIRTKIGSEALERLRTLDNAIRLAEKEINGNDEDGQHPCGPDALRAQVDQDDGDLFRLERKTHSPRRRPAAGPENGHSFGHTCPLAWVGISQVEDNKIIRWWAIEDLNL